MLRYGRLKNSLSGFTQANVSGAGILLAGVFLTGCSADIMRFDAPALGFGSTAVKEQPTPIHTDGSLFEQRPDVSTGLGPSRGYSGGDQSSLKPHQPTRLADGGPLTEGNNGYRPQPVQYNPSARYQPSRVGAGSLPAVPYTPTAPTSEPAQTITVRSGDTLYELARRHGVTVRQIKQANGLSSNMIRPGQQLRLTTDIPDARPQRRTAAPAPRFEPRSQSANAGAVGDTYTVQPGDSLYAISRRTGIRIATLKRINNIQNVRRMRPGMVLKLRETAPASYETAAGRTPTPRISEPTFRPTTNASARPRTANEPIILNPTASKRITEPSQRARQAGTRTASARPLGSPTAANGPQQQSITGGKFRWPVKGRIIRGFGKRSDGTRNEGINIATPIGTEIHAAESGVVAYAGNELKGYGNLILVRHENGFVSAYAHSDRMLVRRGDNVRRGQVIARAGKTGNVKQPQVHFELRQGAKPINPIPHLGRM